MRTFSPCPIAILASLLLTFSASAAPVPDGDAVTFRDGTVLRCRVIEEGAEKVTIRTDVGEFAIPRRIVTAVSRGKDGPARPGPEEPHLGDEAADLARAAVARLSDEDPDVRRSAYRTLTELLPAVRPLLRDAAGREETPAEVRSLLTRLLAARKPRAPSLHAAASRLLENPATALRVLTTRLELTNDQRAKAHPAIQTASAAFAAIGKKAPRVEKDVVEKERRGAWRTFREEMAALLTKEQLAKLEELLLSGGRPKDR